MRKGNNRNKNFQRNSGPGKKKFASKNKIDPRLFVNSPEHSLPVAIKTDTMFSDFDLDPKILRNISEHGYVHPTPIQEKSIPEIINGKDLIGIANTGTGKTAAFLTSLINKCYHDRQNRVLIIAPTRELALQIHREHQVFSKGTDLKSVLLIGGANIQKQIKLLKHNPHFIIGTPGRIKDLIQRKDLNLIKYQNIVLDEVDRMVDIGFINEMKFIISYLPKKRQSLFFSATFDDKTNQILDSFVKDPVTVRVESNVNPKNIRQEVVRINGHKSKISVLDSLLQQEGFDKVLIFGRTKWGTEKLSRALREMGYKVNSIHGNKSQNNRQRALDEFSTDKIQILIATDVVSRGLDIKNVTHVINYDQPATYEDYIHRIGRTGRAGKYGSAITFID